MLPNLLGLLNQLNEISFLRTTFDVPVILLPIRGIFVHTNSRVRWIYKCNCPRKCCPKLSVSEALFKRGYVLYVPVWISKLVVSCIEEEAMSLSVFHCCIPLSPNSDQHQFSPNDIHTLAREMVMGINKMLTKEKIPWSCIKFSQLILKGNVWKSVWRICMRILGLKGIFALFSVTVAVLTHLCVVCHHFYFPFVTVSR